MTALTADRVTHVAYLGERGRGYPVAASTIIYKGSIVCLNASGYAVPGADTSGFQNAVGIALEKVDNSAGAAAAKEVLVGFPIVAKLPCANATQALVGSWFYVADDQTLNTAAALTNDIRGALLIKYISATEGWFFFPGPHGVGTPIATSDIANGAVTAAKIGTGVITPTQVSAKSKRLTVTSDAIDIDNGAGTTQDVVLIRPTTAVTITDARVIYEDATTGTVAAATIQLGTTVGGVDIVAATALENSKAVGTTTALTLASAALAANTPLIARHTGIAATAAGKYRVQVEYAVDA